MEQTDPAIVGTDSDSASIAERLDRLTKLQLATLLRVVDGYTSKQIAREEGVHPRTIDGRVSRAMETIGAQSRAEAARMVRQATYPTTYDRMTYDGARVVQGEIPATMERSGGLRDSGDAPDGWQPQPSPRGPVRWLDPDASIHRRIVIILLSMIAIMAVTVLVLMAYDVVQRILTS